jgi:hydrogenase nickel incorporation protein HypB
MQRTIEINKNIMSANEDLAEAVRQRLERFGVFGLNIMASPGGGKTSLVLRTIDALKSEFSISAVDGDPVMIDVDKIAATGIPVELINTGGSCHLDANMLFDVLDKLDLENTELLIVENVGNLVCPANFSLGTHANIVIASVPEGDDKPYKYPSMFRGADVLVLNKIDTLSVFDFDIEYFQRGIKMFNPNVIFLPISCRTGEGLDAWLSWLRTQLHR